MNSEELHLRADRLSELAAEVTSVLREVRQVLLDEASHVRFNAKLQGEIVIQKEDSVTGGKE